MTGFVGIFDIEYAPHRKPACAHVHKTYAVLLVFAVGHLLDSESPLFELLLEEVVQKAEFEYSLLLLYEVK